MKWKIVQMRLSAITFQKVKDPFTFVKGSFSFLVLVNHTSSFFQILSVSVTGGYNNGWR